MTLVEVIEQVSKRTGLPKDVSSDAVREAIKIIQEAALGGEDVSLVGFGKFRQRIVHPKMAFGKLTSKKVGIRFTPFDSSFRRVDGKAGSSS